MKGWNQLVRLSIGMSENFTSFNLTMKSWANQLNDKNICDKYGLANDANEIYALYSVES